MHHVLGVRLNLKLFSKNTSYVFLCLIAIFLESCSTVSNKSTEGIPADGQEQPQEQPVAPEPSPSIGLSRESLGPPEPELVKQAILIVSPGFLQAFDVIGVIETLEKIDYPIVGFLGSDLSLLFASTYGIRRSRSDVEWLSLKLNEENMFGKDVIKNLLKPWPKNLDVFSTFLKKEAKVSSLIPGQLRFKIVPWKQLPTEASMIEILLANTSLNGVFEMSEKKAPASTEIEIPQAIDQMAKDYPKAIKICLEHDIGIAINNKKLSEKRKSQLAQEIDLILSKWKQVIPEKCDLVLRPNFDGIDPFMPESFELKNQLVQQSRNLLKNKVQELQNLSENKTK